VWRCPSGSQKTLEGAAICDQDANGKACYLVRRIQDKQIKITNLITAKAGNQMEN
jgi:hypothetical protein